MQTDNEPYRYQVATNYYGFIVNKIIVATILLLPIIALGGEQMTWPNLSDIKFVSQRPATEADINNGAAVFLLESEGVNIGSPMDIELPQYAIHTDTATGTKSKVIVIQAEQANGQQVIGAILVDTNELMAGLASEFEMLGTAIPDL